VGGLQGVVGDDVDTDFAGERRSGSVEAPEVDASGGEPGRDEIA